jgi:hypothetical protein
VAVLHARGAGSGLHCDTPGDVQDNLRDERDSSRHPSETGKVVDVDADPARGGGLHHIHAIKIQPKERTHLQRRRAQLGRGATSPFIR